MSRIVTNRKSAVSCYFCGRYIKVGDKCVMHQPVWDNDDPERGGGRWIVSRECNECAEIEEGTIQ